MPEFRDLHTADFLFRSAAEKKIPSSLKGNGFPQTQGKIVQSFLFHAKK